MYAIYSCAPSLDGTDEHTTFANSQAQADEIAQSLREQGFYVAVYTIANERTTTPTESTEYTFMRRN